MPDGTGSCAARITPSERGDAFKRDPPEARQCKSSRVVVRHARRLSTNAVLLVKACARGQNQ